MSKTGKKPLTITPKVRPGMNGSANGAATKPVAILRLPLGAWIGGLLGILLAVGASGALAYSHLSGTVLPGCGAGNVKVEQSGAALKTETVQSACATLGVHPMGSLGGMWIGLKGLAHGMIVDRIGNPVDAAWPVSLLGATYFVAALAGWLVIGRRGRMIPSAIVWLVRLGALASLTYIVVIVVSHKLCWYCISSHTGNFTLLLCMEIGMMKARSLSPGWKMDRSLASLVVGAAVFVLTAGVLAIPEARHLSDLVKKDEVASNASLAALQQKLADDAKAAATQPVQGEKAPWAATGFRGRWLLGPKETSVRVVMLTDFQCPDCRIFEGQAMAALEKNPSAISLSIVHFPMCTDCNEHVSKTMHVNACKAARAAEAGAIMARNKASMEGGDENAAANDMFWKFAKWLFEVKGEFEDKDLAAKLPTLGITDVDGFMKVMNGPKTLQLVQDDARWGEVLGLYYTPMMFVNGVEVRGWLTERMALTMAIDAAVAAKGPAMDQKKDNPPLIGQKFRDDWRLSPRMNIAPAPEKYVQGTPGAKVRVEIFGDLTEPNCKHVHELMETFIGKKAIAYSFRHYPICKACNPNVDDRFPNACIAAQAVEAAGIIGGPEAYFKMRDFVFGRGENVTPNLLNMGAGVLGLDMAKFGVELNGEAAKAAVAADVTVGQKFVTRSIPAVYVDGKYVERWDRKGDNVLEWIIDYAVQHPGEEIDPNTGQPRGAPKAP